MSQEGIVERPNGNFARLLNLANYVQVAYDCCKDEMLKEEIKKVLEEINRIFTFVEDSDEMPEGLSLDALETRAYKVCTYPIEFKQGVIPKHSGVVEMLSGYKDLQDSYERSLQLIYFEYINLIHQYKNSKYVHGNENDEFKELYEGVSTRIRAGELEDISDDLNELRKVLDGLILKIRKSS